MNNPYSGGDNSTFWRREVSQSVIGGHWRSLEVIGGRPRSILGLFSSFRAICRMDGMDGWMGGMVIIGRR